MLSFFAHPLLWVIVAFFVAAWLAWSIKKEAADFYQTAKRAQWPEQPFTFLYPYWWQIQPMDQSSEIFSSIVVAALGSETPVIYLRDPDSESELCILQCRRPQKNLKNWVEKTIERAPLEFDTNSWEEGFHSDLEVVEREGRATESPDDDPSRGFWRFTALTSDEQTILLIYRCAVLAGLVDGYFMRKMVESVKIVENGRHDVAESGK